MKLLNKEQAIAFYKSEIWKDWDYRQIAEFQMVQKKVCVPFSVFHEAIEKTLGRPVYTHEFGVNHDGLMGELFLNHEPPTLEDIIGMIPPEKRVILGIDNDEEV